MIRKFTSDAHGCTELLRVYTYQHLRVFKGLDPTKASLRSFIGFNRLLLQLIFFLALIQNVYGFTTFKNGVLYIEEPVGATLSLPCDVTAPPGEAVAVILWYRDDWPSAAYTFDARNSSHGGLKHHSPRDPNLASRASFNPRPPASLTLTSAIVTDSGHYECRVDFGTAPSKTTTLKVVVVSRIKELLTGRGLSGDAVPSGGEELKGRSTVSAPLNHLLNVYCCARGGHPPPKVWWSSGGKVVDFSFDHVTETLTCNDFTITNITRADDLRTLTCSATNSNVTEGRVANVTLEVLSAPLSSRLVGIPSAFRTGQRYPIECVVEGARPPPTIDWYLINPQGEESLLARQDLSTGSGGRGKLGVTVEKSDEGSILICRSFSTMFRDSQPVEDRRFVTVHFAPEVRLTLGSGLKVTSIVEGADVYFRCKVTSKPSTHHVVWSKGSTEIKSGPFVLVSPNHLVLQNVTRRWSGHYSCTATNSVGSTTSNIIKVIVKYPPVCHSRQRWSYTVTLDSTVTVSCMVKALPREPVTFEWSFTNDVTQEEPVHHFSSTGLTSSLNYTPTVPRQYGDLLCYASNPLGRQRTPCRFSVGPNPDPPPPPTISCRVSNQTWDAVQVSCDNSPPESDGGSLYYDSSDHSSGRELDQWRTVDRKTDSNYGYENELEDWVDRSYDNERTEEDEDYYDSVNYYENYYDEYQDNARSTTKEDKEAKDPAHLIDKTKDKVPSNGGKISSIGGKEKSIRRFLMTVREKESDVIVKNVTSYTGQLTVGGLNPSLDYTLEVIYTSPGGKSKPVKLTALKLRTAENRMRSDSTAPNSGLGAMLGAGLGFIVAVSCLVLAIIIRKKATTENQEIRHTSSTTTSLGATSRQETATVSSLTRCPKEESLPSTTTYESETHIHHNYIVQPSGNIFTSPLALSGNQFELMQSGEPLEDVMDCQGSLESAQAAGKGEYELVTAGNSSPDLLMSSLLLKETVPVGFDYPDDSFYSSGLIENGAGGTVLGIHSNSLRVNSAIPTPPPPDNFSNTSHSPEFTNTFNSPNYFSSQQTCPLHLKKVNLDSNCSDPSIDHQHLIQKHQEHQKALLEQHKTKKAILPPTHYPTFHRRSSSHRIYGDSLTKSTVKSAESSDDLAANHFELSRTKFKSSSQLSSGIQSHFSNLQSKNGSLRHLDSDSTFGQSSEVFRGSKSNLGATDSTLRDRIKHLSASPSSEETKKDLINRRSSRERLNK